MNAFWEEDRPAPASVQIEGVEIVKGSRVRLHPRAGRDILDTALAGRCAFVESIEQDFEDNIHIVVVVEDDPGRDMGYLKQPGHRFFFSMDEVTPADEVDEWPS
jgi:hypothetical protein